MNVEDLSYSTQRKTKEIIRLKNQMKNKKGMLIPTYISTGVAVSYIVFSCQRYFDYTLATITNAKPTTSTLNIFDVSAVILLAFSCFILLSSTKNYSKVKSSYESLRKDLIKTINNEFCNCTNPCSCKDEYIEAMEEYGIDLVF